MSFLRLRRAPLEPDSGEAITTEDDEPTASPVIRTTQPQQPQRYTPSIPLQMPLMNRSKSQEDPPGTSFIRMNHSSNSSGSRRDRATTYDTEEEDDDEILICSEVRPSKMEPREPPSPGVLPAAAVVPIAPTTKRSDPPEWTQSFIHHPVVTSTLSFTSVTTNAATSSTASTTQRRGVPKEIIPQRQLDVPPPRKFDKDRNLISNAPLHGPTRSPEVTLVADSVTSNVAACCNNEAHHHAPPPPSQRLTPPPPPFLDRHDTTVLAPPDPTNPPLLPSLETHGLFSIHRSVQFASVQIHEHIILDTSGESEASQNFVAGSTLKTPDDYSPSTMKSFGSRSKQSDPPSSVLSVVSTVDEYEAQRVPHRRQWKDQEKRSGQFNNERATNRRIPSIRAASSTNSFLIHEGGSVAQQQQDSEYVSVQELAPPKSFSRIGHSTAQQEPLSQNAHDILETYQQSFIDDVSHDAPLSLAAANRNKSSTRRPPAIGRRSVSAPIISTTRQKSSSSSQPERGLFRRLFSKKMTTWWNERTHSLKNL